MSHLLDDPFPAGMFTPAEEAIIEISMTVGLDQLVSRFHATVRTDLDSVTTDALLSGGSCQVPLPPVPPR